MPSKKDAFTATFDKLRGVLEPFAKKLLVHVSFHLMPVYACPDLLKGLSTSLKKRMQGKSCFNFTTIEPAHVKELAALTKTGIARFKTGELPWAP